VQWLASALPNNCEYKDSFQTLMNDLKQELKVLIPRNNRKSRRNVPLGEKWHEGLTEKFRSYLGMIERASEINLTNYSPDNEVLLFTDASDAFWSAVLVSAPRIEDLDKKLANGGFKFILELDLKPML